MERVGRFVVLSTLGQGGMGVVYLAQDPELDRKVALKLLRRELAEHEDSRVGESRLLREAQALARLAHPNVVAIHDVGTVAGQVFIAMEFVEGMSLNAWRRAAVRPWQEVLAIFKQAGRGLEAAHAAGLLHRDFKPDNVMVGKDGRVRVMDFGLVRPTISGDEVTLEKAAPTDSGPSNFDTPITRTGTVLGTPAYMAPEQFARRALDARCDQFSFCVALYEALYGQRPFSGKSFAELSDQVCKGELEPTPAGARVPVWLRRVVLRGLSASPDKRFPSMSALLAALSRKRTSLALPLAAAGAALALGVGGVVLMRPSTSVCSGAEQALGGVWGAPRRAALERAFLGVPKPFAADAARAVAERLDGYAMRWIAGHKDACQATRVRGEQTEPTLALRMNCLDRRKRELGALVDLLCEGDAKVVERSLQAVAALEPIESCADAVALAQPVPPPSDPAKRAEVDELRGQLARAKALFDAGKYADGLVIAKAAETRAAQIGYRPAHAEALDLRGELEDRTGEPKAAEATLRQAVFAAAAGRDDRAEAKAWTLLAWVLGYRLHNGKEAEHASKQAEAVLARMGGDDRIELRRLSDLGVVQEAAGKLDEARKTQERALALATRLFGDADYRVAIPHNNLGAVLRQSGKLAEARAHYEIAIALREKALGPQHPDLANALNNLGNVLWAEGKAAPAILAHRRALEIRERALGPDHPAVAESLNNLGAVYEQERRFPEALEVYRKSLAVREQRFGKKHLEVAESLGNIGNVLDSLGQHTEALALHERALTIKQASLPEGHPELAVPHANMTACYLALRRFPEAKQHARAALTIDEAALGAMHANVADDLVALGQAELGLGKRAAATTALERALAILAKAEPEPVTLARARFAMAGALGKTPRGRDLAEQARAAFAAAGARATKERAEVDAWLGR